ncbi:MAG TPA: hypothetical protein VHV57_14220 [Acidimicrobiales bacterium]|nr:hypothetical protein [Acidimicrobiales bacterium]
MKISAVHHQPQGPVFDIVLLLHVACVVVGLATTLTSAATATRLRKLLGGGAPLPDTVARYFRPGTNWAGRGMYGIPAFGFVLLAVSHGAYGLGDGWVTVGLAIFVGVVLLAEGTLWPAERRLQVSLATYQGGAPDTDEARARDAKMVVWTASAALVLLVAGSVIMVAMP